jgi:hypothetical protein
MLEPLNMNKTKMQWAVLSTSIFEMSISTDEEDRKAAAEVMMMAAQVVSARRHTPVDHEK